MKATKSYNHINSAVRQELISRTPCRDITLPKIPRSRLEYFGPTEAWQIIEECNYPYRAMFAILVLSGVRLGECLALKVKHVDFQAGKIRIEQSWNLKIRVLQQPKSPSSIRSVEMIDCLAEILKDYFKVRGLSDPEVFLFPSRLHPDEPVAHGTVFYVYKNLLKKLGLQHHKIHSLRHSFASIMIASGVAIPTIARNLGHSTSVITMTVYIHEIEELVAPALGEANKRFLAAREALAKAESLEALADEILPSGTPSDEGQDSTQT